MWYDSISRAATRLDVSYIFTRSAVADINADDCTVGRKSKCAAVVRTQNNQDT